MMKRIILAGMVLAIAMLHGNAETRALTISSSSNGSIWASLKEGKPQTMVFYGTSLTEGEFPGAPGEWANEVRKFFKEKYGDRLKIINTASGGRNSQAGLLNLEERVLTHHPDYVLMEFGMNDSYNPYGCTLNQVQKQLDELVTKIRASNPSVGIGLMSMNPKIENATNLEHQGKHNLLPAFYDLYREAAVKHQLDFIDNYQSWIEREKSEPGFLVQHIKDGVHPDGESAKMIVFENLRVFFNEKLK